MDLSIVVPIKDEKDNLVRLHERITQSMAGQPWDYEILLVDDGSIDGSDRVMDELAGNDARLRVVRLRRNFGQSAAMQAGLDHATGAVIVTMDGDLQNDPSDIPMLVQTLHQGNHDAVFGLRAKRQDDFLIRKVPSLIANWLIRKVTGSQIKDMGCTLRAMRRDLVQHLNLYGEMHRFIPVLAMHAGAEIVQVPVRHHPRVAGKTKYNITRTFRVVLDLITVKFMHTYLTRPMHVMGFAGLGCMGAGFLCFLGTLLTKWWIGTFITGNPFLHLGALFVVLGAQFISLGLIGELTTRTYFESQGKRAYNVRCTRNLGQDVPSPKRRAA